MKQVTKWETKKGEFYDSREAAEQAEERDDLFDWLSTDSNINWHDPDINVIVLSVLDWIDDRNKARAA